MDCKHRAGFTHKLSRLKPKASEKMGASSQTMKILLFSLRQCFHWETEHLRTCIPSFALHYTDIFSENRTSKDVKTFFCSSNQCDLIA